MVYNWTESKQKSESPLTYNQYIDPVECYCIVKYKNMTTKLERWSIMTLPPICVVESELNVQLWVRSRDGGGWWWWCTTQQHQARVTRWSGDVFLITSRRGKTLHPQHEVIPSTWVITCVCAVPGHSIMKYYYFDCFALIKPNYSLLYYYDMLCVIIHN